MTLLVIINYNYEDDEDEEEEEILLIQGVLLFSGKHDINYGNHTFHGKS